MEMHDLKTLVDVLNTLKERGYKEDFQVKDDCLMHEFSNQEKCYRPEDIRIVNFYRFEGESDPADSSICYAIECSDGTKGTLVDAYGPYASRKVGKFVEQVEKIHKKTNVDRPTCEE